MCSVVGAEGIRNIYLRQQAHASRYQTQQLTAGQLHKLPPQEVITVWAMPYCPQDTQLGPTDNFHPVHWCCWQGDSKLQDSLQPFICILPVRLSPWPFCFGIHTLPNMPRAIFLHYSKTRTYMNRYSELQHALHKEQGSLELISV